MTPAPSDPENEMTKDLPDASSEQPSESPSAVENAAPAEEAAPEAEAAAPKPTRKKIRWGALCMDAALIMLLLAVLVTAGYYFRLTAKRYHVPTPMEQLLSDSEELERRYNELLPRANQADTQLHMLARLAQLEGQAARNSALIAEKKEAIDDQYGRVLAAQYAIRQADETNRSIARSLLPGMAVGDVTTTTGKAYRNATIYRIDKRYVYLRFPEGQVRFPLRHLVKENLPELARYAFGQLDLVDMSDFEQTGDAPAPVARPLAPAARAAAKEKADGYDPAPGAPVLDTDANRTTTSRVPEDESADDDGWDAPSGDLPM